MRAKQDRLDLAGEAFTVLPAAGARRRRVRRPGRRGRDAQPLAAARLPHRRHRSTSSSTTRSASPPSPSASRSSVYSTDVARMIQAPIFHVNGDDPEACVRVAELAYEFRQEFNKDVVIDMVCYRRRGHNEGDDPSMTQPLMYNLIEAKRSVRKLYTESLIGRGDISRRGRRGGAARLPAAAGARLRRDQGGHQGPRRRTPPTRHGDPGTDVEGHAGLERPAAQAATTTRPPTPRARAPRSRPRSCSTSATPSSSVPDGFTVHPKLQQLLERRRRHGPRGRDRLGAWASCSPSASLLIEGTPVRLAGQDSRRGTFVQRHAVLIDKETAAEWTPLLYLGEDQARFWVYDSLLSEFAAMGFEYGYSVERPDALVLWEAQFGDFVNGAQTIIDEFISSLGAEVGPALVGRAAAPPRLRGPGPGPLLGPHRALPADVRRGQHDGGLPLDARVVLPPAAPSGLRPAAPPADRLHPQVDAAAQGGRVSRGRGLHAGGVPAGACPTASAARPRQAVTRVLLRLGQGRLRPRGRARPSARTPRPRSCGSSSSPRSRPSRSPRRSAGYPGAEVMWVQDEPREPGRLAVHGAQPARGARGRRARHRPLRIVSRAAVCLAGHRLDQEARRSSRRTWSHGPSTADRGGPRPRGVPDG